MVVRQIRIMAAKTAEGARTKQRAGALLTCYLKDNTEGKPHARRTAVLICPGGGYEFCSTREAEPVAVQFLAMDCQAFVLNYSTASSRFPTALRELASAVALIRSHAEEWHIDTRRIVVCGFSAGGHLAASLGVFWNREFVWKALGAEKEEVRPDGLILAYPVISSGVFAHEGSFDHLIGSGKEGEWEGMPEADSSEGERQNREKGLRGFLSLEHQAGSHVPPVFLWHTATDGTVPVENSLLFAWALKRAGVSLELHIFPEGRHGLALASEETSKEMDDGRGTYVVPACQQWVELAKIWLSGLFR